MRDYKQTLNLTSSIFPMRANAAEREPELQARWDAIALYEKLQAWRAKAPLYVLHDGPPYSSSGKIHIGHAMNKVLKDMVVKYKTATGHRAPFVPGYDTHGLPTEIAALKELRAGGRGVPAELPRSGSGQVSGTLPVLELRALCKQFALKSIEGLKQGFKRLGVLGDWDHPYVTLDPELEAAQIRIFGQMAEKGYIYQALKPVYWCPTDATALAEAEIEYEEHTSPSIYVRFPLASVPEGATEVSRLQQEAGPAHSVGLAIWTTTPWTLPANRAIALNPDIDYQVYDLGGFGPTILAVALAEAVLAATGTSGPTLGAPFKGRDLEGAIYRHVFLDASVSGGNSGEPLLLPVILGEHVTLEAGTGAVHTAPGHGAEDYEVGKRYGVPVVAPLDDRGVFTPEAGLPAVVGQRYDKANPVVIDELRERGVLMAASRLSHSYPHCWRCHQPVIFRATEQIFASVEGFRQQALEAIKGVRWVPEFGEVRISNMVAGRTDWCVSRQRVWGVPIPLFYCKACYAQLLTPETIEAVAKRFEVEGADAWWKYPPSELLPPGTRCTCGGIDFEAERDIMDVWFDSGVTHASVLEARSELASPADLYLEGSDQYRGWFQSSLLTAVATRGRAPYKMVLTHGFALDAQGRKMSKSLGNVVDPTEVIAEFGSDVLRLWVASVDYTGDVRISATMLKQLAEVYRKIRNTARFLLSNLVDFDPAREAVPYDRLSEIDRYALHRLQEVIAEVTGDFEAFAFFRLYQTLQNYCVVDLSSFYLDVVKDRLYASGAKDEGRRAAQTVLHEILDALMRLIAPVLSHLAEDIHDHLPDAQKGPEPSVFLLDWPRIQETRRDAVLGTRWERILGHRTAAYKALEEARQAKAIGASIQARVRYLLPRGHGDVALLQELGTGWATVLIVSEATVAEADVAAPVAEVEKSPHAKCERCWLQLPTVGQDAEHPTLCARCVQVVRPLLPLSS